MLVLCCAGAFMAFLDTTIVNVAFPDIEKTFHASADLGGLSWVVNGYNVIIAAFLVPAGRLADRIGRRRSFIAGLVVFAVASEACAEASSVGMLVALRLVQAMGAAILVPTSLALLLPRFTPARRLSAVALWGAASALAAGIGPALGGVLVDVWSWRAVFLVNVPLGLLGAVGAWRVAREEREAGPLPDLIGSGLLAAALGLIALGIVQADEWHWTGPRTLACLVGAFALLTLVAARCYRHRAPVLDLEVLNSSGAVIGNLGALLLSVALYATILNNILFLTGIWRWSVLSAGLALSPAALVTALIARPAGRLAERFGARIVIIPGALTYGAGLLVLAWSVGRGASFLSDWLPASMIVGVGMGLALPNLVGSALAGADVGRLATASGVNAAVRQIGGVLGVALLVSILTAHNAGALQAHRDGWYLAAGFALMGGAVTLALRPLAAPYKDREAGQPVPAGVPLAQAGREVTDGALDRGGVSGTSIV